MFYVNVNLLAPGYYLDNTRYVSINEDEDLYMDLGITPEIQLVNPNDRLSEIVQDAENTRVHLPLNWVPA